MNDMEKANWKDDTELLLMLSDKGTAPVAVPAPRFYSQYEFVIQRSNGTIEVKRFVPEWCVGIVDKMLSDDITVKNHFHRLTYKGNKK